MLHIESRTSNCMGGEGGNHLASNPIPVTCMTRDSFKIAHVISDVRVTSFVPHRFE